MKKIFTLFAAMLFVMTAFADARYYYRGNQNSWGATQMTVSADGYYEYITALSYANNGNKNNEFKISVSASSWDYDQSYLNPGFNGTDITNMGNWASDNNACIYHTTAYYVLVYYPNTAINTTDAPIICASTTLPDNTPVGNTPAVTLAASKTSVKPNTAITLTATATNFTPAADAFNYYYTVDGGAETLIAATNSNTQTFTPTSEGAYVFKVVAANSASQSAEATVNVEVTYPKVWLAGSMNSWSQTANRFTTTDGVEYNLDIELNPISYEFKLKVNTSTWYGKGGDNFDRENNAQTVSTSGGNVTISCDMAGTYHFLYNHSTKLLTVTYPSAPTYETYNVVTYKLAGSFTSWATNAVEMTSNTCRVNLTTADAPEFKIIKVTTTYRDDTNAQVGDPVSAWLGNSGTMTRSNCSGWTMNSLDENNCHLTVDFSGEYVFTINPENDQLTVTYPNYTRSVTNGNYGTICLPYAATLAGATAYEIAGKTANSIVLNEVANLEAGVPYIFEATAGELVATLSGEAVAEAGSANGLVGSFEDTNVAEGMYVLTNNTVKACGTGCTIAANRAYINLAEVSAASPAPEHRVIAIADVATALDATTGSATVVEKMVVNGQLIIIKNGVRYNALGQVVK